VVPDEGGDEVVGVGKVGEPAAPEHRVLALLVTDDVRLPRPALEGDGEQAGAVQLPLELLELLHGLRAVAVSRVPESERDPVGDAGVSEGPAGLGGTGIAAGVEVAGGVSGQPGQDHGVERVDGALADLEGDGGTVHDLGDGPAHGRNQPRKGVVAGMFYADAVVPVCPPPCDRRSAFSIAPVTSP
jgi:hypothetical protein